MPFYQVNLWILKTSLKIYWPITDTFLNNKKIPCIPLFFIRINYHKCQSLRYSLHCAENIQIRSFFWSVFFRICTEYSVNLRIQSKYEKIRTRKTLYLDIFLRSVNGTGQSLTSIYFTKDPNKTQEAVVRRCSVKIVFLKNFRKNSQKNTCATVSFLIKLNQTLLKKRLWHRCFPVNFAKFLRTPFSTEHLRRLLLKLMVLI